MTEVENMDWPLVYGKPPGLGLIRVRPEDFIVNEQLAFAPEGSGEHVFLQIEKIGQNTDFVAKQLARFAGVNARDVGYAGIKDRHAVTTQWFSIWLPGASNDPAWSAVIIPGVKLIQTTRHARKLKRGVLSGNRFQITIRDWQGDCEQTLQRLEAIQANGVPNYYGEQRFGYRNQNVAKALAMFSGAKVNREQRSLYLSAARAFLFNHILAIRVSHHTWNQALPGDCFNFDRSRSRFKSEQPDDNILRRLQAQEIHATGLLSGKGVSEVSGEVFALESELINRYPELANGLTAFNLASDRRPLRVLVQDPSWRFLSPSILQLSFGLPPGSYATAVVRELIEIPIERPKSATPTL